MGQRWWSSIADVIILAMARSKNSKGSNSEPKTYLQDETKHGVIAVVCFAVALFFLLSRLHYAGAVGDAVYQSLSGLFGTGFFVIPLVLFFLGLSFMKSLRPDFILYRFLAGLVFFIAFLGLISLISPSPEAMLTGGWVGNLLAQPVKKLFDLYGLILFLTIMAISLLVIFDVKPNLNKLSPLYWYRRNQQNKLANRDQTTNPASLSTAEEETEPKIALANQPANNKNKKTETGSEKNNLNAEEFAPAFLSGRKRSDDKFTPPPLSLLEPDSGKPGAGDIKGNTNIIKRTLQNFGIVVEMDEVAIGPSITRYALKPAEGVKLSRIVALQNDLSLALAAHPLRIEAPIPGKSLVGIEIPNTTKSVVGLASLVGSAEFASSPHPLLASLGRGITGGSHFANLAKAPHALIAGATGSGKSVVIHTFITSMLYRNSPERLRFIMIDPKRVELTLYNKIPHLLTPVITEAKKAILALKWAIKEMERRYNVLENSAVRDIASYHKNFGSDEKAEKMPYIVIVIDELADIMSSYPRELEGAIVRLAQMSRAVGIHLVLSTQRPSVDVITGLIKANIPMRIALQVASQIDSRTILDMAGAEKLLGSGDMLYLAGDMGKPIRLQSAFISEGEVKAVTNWLAKHYQDADNQEINLTPGNEPGVLFSVDLSPGADDDGDSDDLYEEAREEVIRAGKASASYLQRKLKVGYARAARLLDLLEERGVIGPGDGAKQRDVYEKPVDGIGSQTQNDPNNF